MNYNNHANLFRIVILIDVLLSVTCFSLNAQGFLKEPYDSYRESPVPFPVDSTYLYGHWTPSSSYGERYMQSLKFYDNFNLDHEFDYSVDDECYDFHIFAKFSIPDSEYKMILAHANYIEYGCSGLFLSDSNGNQIDYLACENYFYDVIARQFFIDENYDITVYSLVPDSGDIKMSDLLRIKSFPGHRVDQKYRVINGHFTLLETITYQSKVYYYKNMDNKSWSYIHVYRIREGNETVESRQQQ